MLLARSGVVPGKTMSKWLLIALILGLMESATGQDVASVHLVEQAPVTITKAAPGVFLVDFGRVAFGNLSLNAVDESARSSRPVTVRFGEALKAARVDTRPPGYVRYAEVTVA